MIIGLKKMIIGLDTGKHIGISYMYNFRYDSDLGIGKTACRQVLCAYLICLKMLKLPWDVNNSDDGQPIYGVNKRCIYWKVFDGYNDQKVVRLKKKHVSNDDNQNRVYKSFLHGIEARMNEQILIGTFGAMRTDEEATRGYHIVKWISELYIV